MILDHLNNSHLYEGMHPLFKKAFDYLKKHDLSQVEPGKLELDGDKLYLNIQNPDGKTPEAARLEAHRKYIDIQVLLKGKEAMGWKQLAECKEVTTEYNEAKDVEFYAGLGSTQVELQEGEFCIFFPGDTHAPCIGDGKIKKVIVKVLI